MAAAGGEPRLLLNALRPMLGMRGDIKTPQEVVRIVGMMKDAEKLVSRCVYLSILRATCEAAETVQEKQDALLRFLAGGGWGILNKWMNEFMKTENFTMLSEVLEVLKLLPVSVDLLKQGNTGKVLKQLCKANSAVVKRAAGNLIRKWKDMIRGDSAPKRAPNGEKKADDAEGPVPAAVKRQGSVESKEPPDKRPRLGSNSKVPPKVKLIEPLPKAAMESGGFMDALIAAAPSKSLKKKRKLIPLKGAVSNAAGSAVPKTHLPLDEILSTHEIDTVSTPPKDISDSPASSPCGQDEGAAPAASPVHQADTSTPDAAEKDASKRPSSTASPLLLRTKRGKKKKSLRWAPDESLVEVSYFELNEEELANLHHGNFDTAKHNELLLERRTLANARKKNEDTMAEKIPWRRPTPVEMAPLSFEPGSKSKEKIIQMEREKKVLADIFLTKASLPDSPAEADIEAETGMRAEPALIPHDEDGTIYPSVQTPQPAKAPVRPSAATNTTAGTSASSSSSPAAPTEPGNMTNTVQTILDQLMVKKGSSGSPRQSEEQGRRHHNAGPAAEMPPEGVMLDGPPFDVPYEDPQHPNDGYNGPPHMPFGPHHGPPMHMMRPRGPPPAGQPVPLLSMKLPPRGPNRGGFRGNPRGMGPRGPPHDHMGGPPFHGRDFDDGNMDGDYDMGDDDGMGGPPPMQGPPPGPWMRPQFRGRGGRGMMRGRGRGRGRGAIVCRHFNTSHGCRMGMNCHFLHPGVNGPPLV